MNYNTICNVIGKVLKLEAGFLVLPMIVAAIYKEDMLPFVAAIITALLIGLLLTSFFKDDSGVILLRDGYAIVSFAWISIALIGTIPFMVSGEIPDFFDAFFEMVSGFTTTGASILTDVESMSRGLLFWRSFSHWIGGMGILVFIMAISLRTPGRSANILRAEMPGHSIDKLVPRTTKTASILYIAYLALTAIEIIFLLAGGMPVFDSVVHTMGTAGTGGFGIKADSIGSYSAYLQWVIAVFMLLFGVNFNYYYLVIFKQGEQVLKSNELRWYLRIAIGATVLISMIVFKQYGNIGDTVRNAFFQVSSIMTTTGYSTTDYNLWPSQAKGLIFMLLFVGGCIGSTAGGLKISRLVILWQAFKNHLKNALNPRVVRTVHLNGKNLDEGSSVKVLLYVMLYLAIILVGFVIISFEPFGFETNLTAVIACMSNVGPGLGAVGPAGSFAAYSDFSKFVLSIIMLIGRLEIYPIFAILAPVRRGRI